MNACIVRARTRTRPKHSKAHQKLCAVLSVISYGTVRRARQYEYAVNTPGAVEDEEPHRRSEGFGKEVVSEARQVGLEFRI